MTRKRGTARGESQSATVTIRMPSALHQAVAGEAARRRTSINALAVDAIRRSLSSTEWMTDVAGDAGVMRYIHGRLAK
ncbi:MAG TPA: toxin-antitoxin system HicB family antitoxin [Pirellulales bacterium]|nr:toxin-antitoxin system HicB family antitoxin [Pirellulales bacterium]